MYALGVERRFTANHYLIGGDWGEENIEHSHDYRIEIVLEKQELNQHGFLVDIVEVEHHLDAVVKIFANKTLNDLPAFAGLNPSIEQLATTMHGMFAARFEEFGLEMLQVSIKEDDIAWTSYRAHL